MSNYRKKLIEVALPLDAINKESAREKSIRHGHPSTLHLWWARRPLGACRAVLFGQLVDDPSGWPDRFPTDEDQNRERQRLFRVIQEMVRWENSSDASVLDAARFEIAQSLARGRARAGLADDRDAEVLGESASPKAVRAYLAEVGPLVHDPFAGGGSIPLEAQRLGLRSIATDLNPVAVMINRALIELPPKFAGVRPVGPVPVEKQQSTPGDRVWPGCTGLAEDIRRYGAWMRDEAFARIGQHYPEVELPKEEGGGKVPVIAWLWARTVESPNPAFRGVHVPLVRSFMLCTKKKSRAWIEPVFSADRKTYEFEVRRGEEGPEIKTTVARSGGTCLASGDPIPFSYIREEAKQGRMEQRLFATVAMGDRKRVYLQPTAEMERVARSAQPKDAPDTDLPLKALGFRVQEYGISKHRDLFTDRQLAMLTTIADLILEVREKAIGDARAAGWNDDGCMLDEGGSLATAYGDALAVYLAFSLDKVATRNCTQTAWYVDRESTMAAFSRQALPMTWDFAEVNPFNTGTGTLHNTVAWVAEVIETATVPDGPVALVGQRDARSLENDSAIVFCTDPPYYDNIGYADLSDFFYVWLRRSLRDLFPSTFSTLLTPKSSELIAEPHRHGGKDEAEASFLSGMKEVLARLSEAGDPDLPLVLFYAFKQSETNTEGTSSTGWETFLEAIVEAGMAVTGTWPVRSEQAQGIRSIGRNALSSSIVLVCRSRADDAQTITRGDFRRLLRSELPRSLAMLQKGNVAPVDMAQASLGPGMEVFSRHARVLEADGSAMSVRSALQLIHQVSDEAIGEEEGEFDRETRFAATWFENHGFDEGPYGDAETLATARSVSVSGVKEAGVLKSGAGKVRLYARAELPESWDPQTDDRLTVWEGVQHLIKRLGEEGERPAAELLARLGPIAEHARSLAYRLYTTCERRGWAEEAQAYNGLVLAWPELEKLASESASIGGSAPQAELFE